MISHLVPRVRWSGWSGDALTIDPAGGKELPAGFARDMRIVLKQPTVTPEYDEARGGVLTIQWLSLLIEIGVGRVT